MIALLFFLYLCIIPMSIILFCKQACREVRLFYYYENYFIKFRGDCRKSVKKIIPLQNKLKNKKDDIQNQRGV